MMMRRKALVLCLVVLLLLSGCTPQRQTTAPTIAVPTIAAPTTAVPTTAPTNSPTNTISVTVFPSAIVEATTSIVTVTPDITPNITVPPSPTPIVTPKKTATPKAHPTPKRTVTPKATATPDAIIYEEETPEPTPTHDISAKSIVFIGNSMTNAAQVAEQLQYFVEANGKKLNIYDISKGNYYITLHLADLENNTTIALDKKLYQDMDYIVVQDYGHYLPVYSDKENNEFVQIKKIFGRNKKYYAYIPNLSYTDIIPFGYSDLGPIKKAEEMLSDIDYELISTWVLDHTKQFAEENFRYDDGLHMNPILGHIIANLIYCEIFGARCTDQPMTPQCRQWLPSVDEAGMQKEYREVLRITQKLYDQYMKNVK